MELIYKSIHKIDYEMKSISEVIPNDSFNGFTIDIITNTNNNIITKEYETTSQATQVISDVRNIISTIEEENDNDVTLNRVKEFMVDIAKRLLEKEIAKQEQINRMGQNVKRGSLIQAVVKENNEYSYLLAKVEHSSFFDDNDFSLKTGFSNEQKKIWKTCILECNVTEEYITIQNAKIYLNNPSKYWAEDFLELKEVCTDGKNTKNAFKSIDALLNQKLKEEAPSDYTVIRNSFVGYMKREQLLDYNQMVEDILGNYVPEMMSNNKIMNLKIELLELPDKKRFDRLFSAVPKEVKARIKKIYQVNDGINIRIDDFVENIKETISAVEDINTGAKYIKIMTNNEEVFREFK